MSCPAISTKKLHEGTEEFNESFYNDEAEKIFAQVRLAVAGDPSARNTNRYNNLDAVFALPKKKDEKTGLQIGGGCIYVGNHGAASGKEILAKHNITHIVNCTHGYGAIPCFFLPKKTKTNGDEEKKEEDVEGSLIVSAEPSASQAETPNMLRYYRFPVSDWKGRMAKKMQENADKNPHRATMDFIQPMLNFIESALLQGSSVLIHCLAGAHRAGTTGVLALMYFHNKYMVKNDMEQMSREKAVLVAKQLRPAIDPIGRFPEFLQVCEAALMKENAKKSVSGYDSAAVKNAK